MPPDSGQLLPQDRINRDRIADLLLEQEAIRAELSGTTDAAALAALQAEMAATTAAISKLKVPPKTETAVPAPEYADRDLQATTESDIIRGLSEQIQSLQPELSADQAIEAARVQYTDYFPGAIEPSGQPALGAKPDVSVDFEAFTLIDPETGLRRKMTSAEAREKALSRKVLYTLPSAPRKC